MKKQQRRRKVWERESKKIHDRHLAKAMRRVGPYSTEVATRADTWLEVDALLAWGWQLKSSERKTWQGTDMPGVKAVLTYQLQANSGLTG